MKGASLHFRLNKIVHVCLVSSRNEPGNSGVQERVDHVPGCGWKGHGRKYPTVHQLQMSKQTQDFFFCAIFPVLHPLIASDTKNVAVLLFLDVACCLEHFQHPARTLFLLHQKFFFGSHFFLLNVGLACMGRGFHADKRPCLFFRDR